MLNRSYIISMVLLGAEARKSGQFLLCTGLIYACYISSGVYHEKLIKQKYSSDIDSSADHCPSYVVFSIFPPLVAFTLGTLIRCANNYINQAKAVHIPYKKSLACGTVINCNMWTYNTAIEYASFPAAIMVKSCSLLSVIMVGIFCSRVKDSSLKLGKNKLVIGGVVTVGIVLFNLFKTVEKGNDKPITLISTALLLISLFGDGLLPDLQAQIKSVFKPGVLDMYVAINRATFSVAMLLSIISMDIVRIGHFMFEHSQFTKDIMFFSLLNAGGQLVIYRMIKLFRQHIPSFVIATRKCLTVVVSIVHFGHSVNWQQGIGIALVFAAVLMEVTDNYLNKNKPGPQPSRTAQARQVPQSDSSQEVSLQDDVPSAALQTPK